MKNLIGNRYHNWEVIVEVGRSKHNKRVWACKCLLCDNIYNITQDNLITLKTKMCTLCSREKRSLKIKKEDHRLYSTWKSMRNRCNNTKNHNYHNYGGRGIKVCEYWNTFENFLRDMESTFKEGLTLDRIDVNSGYYLTNCRWASIEEQANNKRDSLKLFYRGEYYTEALLAKKTGVSRTTIQVRRNNGWSVEEMVNGKEHIEKFKNIKYKGSVYKSLQDIAIYFNIEPNTFRYRIRKGLSIDQAINYEKFSTIRI
jgi:hypothetical protein